MTDLERVRNRIQMHLSVDTLEMFDTHLKEDAEREKAQQDAHVQKMYELETELARLREDERVWTEENDRLREELVAANRLSQELDNEIVSACEERDRLREEKDKLDRLHANAQDQILKLREELVATREEADHRHISHVTDFPKWQEAEAEFARLREERDRYKETLEEIVTVDREDGSKLWNVVAIARNALKEAKSKSQLKREAVQRGEEMPL